MMAQEQAAFVVGISVLPHATRLRLTSPTEVAFQTGVSRRTIASSLVPFWLGPTSGSPFHACQARLFRPRSLTASSRS